MTCILSGMSEHNADECFHDGFLDGLRLHETSQSVAIYLRTEQDDRFILRLNGLERLTINDFREGNIVFDLTFIPAQVISIAAINEVYRLSDSQNETAKRLLLSAQQGRLQLLEIASSCGATGIALFKEYSLLPEE